jgi:hypothetical protein
LRIYEPVFSEKRDNKTTPSQGGEKPQTMNAEMTKEDIAQPALRFRATAAPRGLPGEKG